MSVAVSTALILLLAFKAVILSDAQKINIKCVKNAGFTKAEVQRHNKPHDLWLIYDSKVFNMTEFFPNHPGGAAMLKKAGKDASDVLLKVGSHISAMQFIQKKMNELCIGKVKA